MTQLAETVENLGALAAVAGLGLLILLMIGGLLFLPFAPKEQAYDYTVKMEQVQDASAIEDSAVIEFENLSEQQHAVLFHAFKKTDHFMGESSVTFTSEQRYETFDGWKVLDVNGVKLLVAVQEEPTTDIDWSETVADEIADYVLGAVLLLIIVGLPVAFIASLFTPVRY